MSDATRINRRQILLSASAASLLPLRAQASEEFREIMWEDLIPPGVPYSEIIAEGDLDEINDTWAPIFDENGVKLNTALNGQRVKLPGYIVPLETGVDGVSEFIFAPYLGACIHVPPPPPNQLVFVTTQTPWPSDSLWDAIWVYGQMNARLQTTELAEIGYELIAEKIEFYQW